ncbi:cysteine repeat modular protein 4 [Reticulomyxa filosa]|uniref:Cysteine repeat modular protein 4 n=1 Tax=Reticulomyxa filosa TaxID=46433 RepID=X6MB01_RETFI|nr:cysteine repeat modular protein 4 [Reticulomyxa filosa]|eukprot:ETO10215.1 cysteine repeat modular protein 4 [Reticulomyxa filosa]
MSAKSSGVEENFSDVVDVDFQKFKNTITKKLNKCQENLQKTKEQMSFLENHRETEKIIIHKQFEIIEREISEMIAERKQKILASLDEEVDLKLKELTERTKVYQDQTTEGINLQPLLAKLEEFEKRASFNSPTSSLVLRKRGGGRKKKGEFFFFFHIHQNAYIYFILHKTLLKKKKRKKVMQFSIIQRDNPINSNNKLSVEKGLQPGGQTQSNKTLAVAEPMATSSLPKKKMEEEIRKFLVAKTPAALSPVVAFDCNRAVFLKAMKRRVHKFGWIMTSSGSYREDIKMQMKDRLGWIGQQTTSLTNKFWHRREETTELKEIPPPVLLMYFGIERTLAEEFVEIFTVTASHMPAGCVIPVIDLQDEHSLKQWLCYSADISANHQFKSIKKKHGGFRIPGINRSQEKFESQEEIQIIPKGAQDSDENDNEDDHDNDHDNNNDNHDQDNHEDHPHPPPADRHSRNKVLEGLLLNKTRRAEIQSKMQRLFKVKPSIDEIEEGDDEYECYNNTSAVTATTNNINNNSNNNDTNNANGVASESQQTDGINTADDKKVLNFNLFYGFAYCSTMEMNSKVMILTKKSICAIANVEPKFTFFFFGALFFFF